MNKKVEICDVGPRDGFQNIKTFIPTDIKKAIIDAIVAAGLRTIQCTSFSSPKAVPQMRDSVEVAEYCLATYPDVNWRVLVPNLFGAKRAKEVGIKNISKVISLSNSHNLSNIRRTRAESLEELKEILDECPELNVSVDIATAFGCPFEGIPEIDSLLAFMGECVSAGITVFTLSDTIGVATPLQVKETIQACREAFPSVVLRSHFHDTRNNGVVNTYTAIENGITEVEGALGGLGGCPFAPGATGNVATEDLVWLLNSMGYDTGIDTEKLVQAARFEHEHVEGEYSGHQLRVPDCQPNFFAGR